MKKNITFLLTLFLISCGTQIKDSDLPKYNFEKSSNNDGEKIITYRVTIIDEIVTRTQLISLATKLKEGENSKFVNIHFYAPSADKKGLSQFSVLYGDQKLANDKDIHEKDCQITDRTESLKSSSLPIFKIK